MSRQDALRKIIRKAGSMAELARLLNTSRSYVNDWEKGRAAIPPRFVRKLVVLSEGEVLESDLRPDIFYPINLDQKKIAYA